LEKIKIDIKTLLLIITTTCVMAGLYYTTEATLKSLEMEISFLNSQVHALKVEDKRLNRLIRNLKKEKTQ